MRHRRLLKNWLSGLGIALSAGATVADDKVEPVGHGRASRGVPYAVPVAPTLPGIPCPPLSPVPTTPTTPTDPSQPQQPQAPIPDAAAPAATPGFAEAPSAGTGGGAAIAPNMMGDLFGGRSITVGFDRRLTVTFPQVPPAPGGVLVVPRTGSAVLAPVAGQGGQTFTSGRFTALTGVDPYVQSLLSGQALTPQQAATAQALLQAAISGQNLTAQQAAALPPNIRAQLPQIQNRLNAELRNATNGLTIPSATVGPVTGELLPNGDLQYTALLTSQTVVPLPGASTVVGRVKLSEENNPIPRDRFIFVYDYFDNVPFSQNGLNVNRFQFGLEKTFLDGRASLEVRLPFASTLTSTSVQGLEATGTELGNLRFALKYLWVRNQRIHYSTGLGVTLPTADDTIVNSIDGTNLYRLTNESVQLEPFAALLLTPTERLFGQIWSSVNFDASGGDLTYNRAVFGGSGSARIWDLPILAVDAQIGYWLVRNEFATLRGLAPFLELHWNYAIAQDRLIREINERTGAEGLTVGTIADHELNLTAGMTSQVGNNLLITVGASAPLLQRPDRTFDGQFGVRVNYFFGRTARERSAPVMVSGF